MADDLKQVASRIGGIAMEGDIIIERLLMRHIYKLDHLYGLLLTFGLTAGYLVVQHWRRTRTQKKA